MERLTLPEPLQEGDDRRHVWASGIGYYRQCKEPRGTLRDVLRTTRCCDTHVVDIVVEPPS